MAGTEENLKELCNQKDIYGLTPLEYLLVNNKNNNIAWENAVNKLFELSTIKDIESIKNNIKKYLELKGKYNSKEYLNICRTIDNKYYSLNNIINTKPQPLTGTTKAYRTYMGSSNTTTSEEFEFSGGEYSKIVINGKTFCKSNFRKMMSS